MLQHIPPPRYQTHIPCAWMCLSKAATWLCPKTSSTASSISHSHRRGCVVLENRPGHAPDILHTLQFPHPPQMLCKPWLAPSCKAKPCWWIGGNVQYFIHCDMGTIQYCARSCQVAAHAITVVTLHHSTSHSYDPKIHISATVKTGFECFNSHARRGQGSPWEGGQHPQQHCCRGIQYSRAPKGCPAPDVICLRPQHTSQGSKTKARRKTGRWDSRGDEKEEKYKRRKMNWWSHRKAYLQNRNVTSTFQHVLVKEQLFFDWYLFCPSSVTITCDSSDISSF